MKKISATAPRKPGRPKSFDRDVALEQAMHLFWRHGYESTSLADLTAAMGISPPSLYAAFGDKKTLFREVVRRYLGGGETAESIIANAPSAFSAAEALLHGSAILFTGESTPPGCLVASAAASCSASAADIQHELAQVRSDTQSALRTKIERDIDAGLVAPGADANAHAAHVVAVIQGMSTLARDGATRATLLRMAGVALSGWPPAPPRPSRRRH